MPEKDKRKSGTDSSQSNSANSQKASMKGKKPKDMLPELLSGEPDDISMKSNKL